MKKILIGLIRFYKKYISPKSPPCCRFIPSCSQYGLEAVERYGALKGSFLTLIRILRCNPWSAGGYDPVPKNLKTIKLIDYKAIKNNEKK